MTDKKKVWNSTGEESGCLFFRRFAKKTMGRTKARQAG